MLWVHTHVLFFGTSSSHVAEFDDFSLKFKDEELDLQNEINQNKYYYHIKLTRMSNIIEIFTFVEVNTWLYVTPEKDVPRY